MSDSFTIRDEANTLVALALRSGFKAALLGTKGALLANKRTHAWMTDESIELLRVAACQKMAELLELKASDPAKYARQIKSYNAQNSTGWER